MKSVQIPEELFVQLIKYHLCEDDLWEEEIKTGLERKMENIINRITYTDYKTAPTEEERENARQKYLDRKGYRESFRW
ncbi:complexin-2 [Eubacterium sp. 1001713B170207_170306_E7]|uniref:complexin-2 n=1 Tax=Eubacterium sp. 1001713B170207_170306_E7 TaxID=2787097 RepID=UPI0018999226|nr:complexin-2 [Eubacterium sp. 1001713B170207_170306_E7]